MADVGTQQAPTQDTGSLTPEDIQQMHAMDSPPPGGNIVQAQPAPTQGTDTGSLSTDDVKALQQLGNTTLKVSPTGQTVEPQSGYISWVDSLAKDATKGLYSVGDDLNGTAGFFGMQTPQQMEQYEQSMPAIHAQTAPDDYKNQYLYPQLVQTAGHEVIQSIPGFAMGVGGALVAGGAAVALGASAPVIATAAVGGAAVVGGALALGGMYKYLTKQNVDPTTARVGAAAAGIVSTGLGMINLGAEAKIAGGVAKDVIMSSSIKQTMMKAAGRYFTATGVNVGIGEVQGFVNSVTKYIATRMSHSDAKQYSQQDWFEDFKEVTKNVLSTAPVFTGAVEATGATIGAATKGYHSKLAEMTARFDEENKLLLEKAAAEKVAKREAAVNQAQQNKQLILMGKIEEAVNNGTVSYEDIDRLMQEANVWTAEDEAGVADNTPSLDANNIQKSVNALKPGSDGKIDMTPLVTMLKGEVMRVFQGMKPVAAESSANKPLNAIQKFMRSYNAGNSNFKGLLEIAGQDTPPEQRQVLTGLAEYMHDIVQKVDAANRKGLQKLDGALRAATGLKQNKLEGMISKLASKQIKIDYKNSSNGGTTTYHASGTAALQDYMWAHDPDAQAGMRARGFTLTDDEGTTPDNNWQDQVHKALVKMDPKLNSLLHGLVEDYNSKDTTEPIVKAFKEKNGGKDLAMKQTYYGRIVRKVTKEPSDAEEFDDFAEQLNEKMTGQGVNKETQNPVNTIERVKNDNPTAPTDAYLNAVTNVYMRTQLTETWQAGEILNGVFNDPDVRTVLSEKLGKGYLNELDAAIEDSLHGPSKGQTRLQGGINYFMGKFGVVKLGGPNLLRIPMHTVQLINIALAKNMSVPKLAAGVADFWLDPVGNTKQFMSRDFAKGRYENSANTFLATVRKNKSTLGIRAHFDELMMAPLKLGDMSAAIPGWHAVYKAELALGKSSEEAATAADRAINEVMYSSSSDQMSNFNAGRGMFGGRVYRTSITKLIGLATQIPTKMFQMQVDAVRDAVNHPTTENYAKAARVIVTTHIANALFESLKTGWVTLTSKDGDRITRAWLDLATSLITGPMPVIEHLVLSPVALAMRNGTLGREDKFMEFETYPQSIYGDVMKCFQAWSHANAKGWDDDKANAAFQVSFLKAFNETVTGLPEAPIKAISDLTK